MDLLRAELSFSSGASTAGGPTNLKCDKFLSSTIRRIWGWSKLKLNQVVGGFAVAAKGHGSLNDLARLGETLT